MATPPSQPPLPPPPRPTSTGRALVGLGLYGSGLGAVIWAAAIAAQRGVRSGVVVLATLLVTALVCLILERRWPLEGAWLQAQGDVQTDLWHLLLSNSLAGAGRWAAVTLLSHTPTTVAPALALWPQTWPLLWQLGLALFLVEGTAYALHVAQHQLRPLWRVHAVHHSASRLYFLNQLRSHPLDALLTGCALIPPVLLGAPEPLLTVLQALLTAALLLQHANVDFRLGRASALLNLAEAHRWHHARDAAQASCNYGGMLLLFDHLFGTYRASAAAATPALGLDEPQPFPRDYLGQLLAPFEPSKPPDSLPRGPS